MTELKPLPWQAAIWQQLHPAASRHHALLLAGPAGIGKRRLGQAMAAAHLCQQPAADHTACGECAACGWFLAGNHPDFRLLSSEAAQQEAADVEGSDDGHAPDKRASQQIGIEQVRDLASFMALTTHRGGLRVLLLEPADALNAAAANALLKTLEEPPAASRFVLVSSQPRRLPVTLRSRCLAVRLGLPETAVALRWLEDQGVDAAPAWLARAAGSPLRALALAQAGLGEGRSALTGPLQDADFDPHSLAEKATRDTVVPWTEALQQWCHDLLLARAGAPPRFHPEDAAALARLARSLRPAALLDWELRLRAARVESRQPVNARLFLDELLMGYRRLFP